MIPLSVVVPCFNQAQFLPECLRSLAAQTWQPFEVVVVDDGSNVPLFATEYDVPPELEVSVVWLPENQGTAAALNAGIKIAGGMYIAVVHADDLVEPWYLEQMLAHAGERFCYGDLRVYIDPPGVRGGTLRFAPWDLERAKQKNLAHGAILFPRHAWEEAGGYPELMRDGREDWAMTLRLAHAGYPGYHVEGEPGYLYRRHGNNRSSRNHTPEWTARFAEQIRVALPEVFS